jgi:hypothetical protein
VVSSEELREDIKAHLALEHLPEQQAVRVIDFNMGRAAIKIAGMGPFRDLLVTTYVPYSDDGKFSVKRRITPHQAFIDGDEGKQNWRRLIPIDFDHFSMQSSGIDTYFSYSAYSALSGMGGRRYTVLPKTDSGTTFMQILDPVPAQSPDCANKKTVKLIYYPIIPAIDEFPEEFIPLLLYETLVGIAPHIKLQSGNSYVEQLKLETKEMRFKLKNIAEKIETNYNQQQHNDITQAFLTGQTSDLFLFNRTF